MKRTFLSAVADFETGGNGNTSQGMYMASRSGNCTQLTAGKETGTTVLQSKENGELFSQ